MNMIVSKMDLKKCIEVYLDTYVLKKLNNKFSFVIVKNVIFLKKCVFLCINIKLLHIKCKFLYLLFNNILESKCMNILYLFLFFLHSIKYM